MRGVAGRHEPLGVEHERLVGAGLGGLDAGEDAVELGVGVELRVLHVRGPAPDVHGEQAQPLREHLRPRRLVLRDDHDGGPADAGARILVRGALESARHHQPHVRPFGHLVGAQGLVERLPEGGTVKTDVQVDRLRRLEQPRQVRIEEGDAPLVHAQALPDAIPQDEPGVEHRDHRLRARQQRTVDVDLYVLVARVLRAVVRAVVRRVLLCIHRGRSGLPWCGQLKIIAAAARTVAWVPGAPWALAQVPVPP